MDIFEMMESDSSDSLKEVNTEGLKTIAEMIDAMTKSADYMKSLEERLKEAKQKHIQLTDQDLPDLLRETGNITGIDLEDGSKLVIRDIISAHIKVENRDQAYQWLRDNGYDDIIKNTVSTDFGRGEEDLAEGMMQILKDNGLEAQRKSSIHPSTLRAFVKEQLKSGVGEEEFPSELFGAYLGQRAEIKGGSK